MSTNTVSFGKLVGRAQTNLQKAILSLLPEQVSSVKMKDFTWMDYFQTFRLVHAFYAFLGLGIVISLGILIYKVPILNLSIVGALNLGVQGFVTNVLKLKFDVTPYTTLAFILALVYWRKDVGSIFGIGPFDLIKRLPWFAMREELVFRVGSENWTFFEKVRACLSFGLLHFTMLVVPLGIALCLSFAGAVFMYVYLATYKKTESRKEAVKDSATVHTAYNIYVITILVTALVIYL